MISKQDKLYLCSECKKVTQTTWDEENPHCINCKRKLEEKEVNGFITHNKENDKWR